MSDIKDKRRKAIEDFEHMTETAELRALSKASLERPLTIEEYHRFICLGTKHGLVKNARYKGIEA